MSSRKGVAALLLVSFVMLALAYLAVAATRAEADAQAGQAVFQSSCAGCHSIGGGRGVGPDLKGVTQLRDPKWLARFILEPDKVIAEKDPIAVQLLADYNNFAMPNLGLSAADVASVIDYLASVTPPPTATPPATSTGDAQNGRALFKGAVRFSNGGPACVACHDVVGIGTLGGGVVGPDLTGAYQKFGGPGLAGILAALPFPTMRPIYEKASLTGQEQADMAAFLANVQATGAKRNAGLLAGLVVGGIAALAVLAQLLWRRRLRSVRAQLVQQSQQGQQVMKPATKASK